MFKTTLWNYWFLCTARNQAGVGGEQGSFRGSLKEMSCSQCHHQCQWDSGWQFSRGLASVWNLDTPEHKSLMPGSSIADWHLSPTYRHGVAVLLQMTCPTFGESKGSDGNRNDNYLLVSSCHMGWSESHLPFSNSGFTDFYFFFSSSYSCKESSLLLKKAGDVAKVFSTLERCLKCKPPGLMMGQSPATEAFSLRSLKQYDFAWFFKTPLLAKVASNTRVSGDEWSAKFDPLQWFVCGVHGGWVCLKCLKV